MTKIVDEHDETWKNMKNLYSEIKKLSVNDYLRLYHMMSDDIEGKYLATTISNSNITFER